MGGAGDLTLTLHPILHRPADWAVTHYNWQKTMNEEEEEEEEEKEEVKGRGRKNFI